MTRTQSYRLASHGDMITDPSRAGGYVPAMQQQIKPGQTVVDLGAGTGFFALVACRLGAGHVYAIEPDDVIDEARRIAEDCGYSDRITFFKDLSTNVELPEPADVIVSDIRGVLPLYQHHIPSIVDARRRLLKPEGTMIPYRDRLWAALVSAPELAKHYSKPWLDNEFGLNLTRCHSTVCSAWRKASLKPESVLVDAQQWGVLDYTTVDSPNLTGQLSWTSDHEEDADGLLIWFDADLGAGFGYSNAPGKPEHIYGQAFFPLERPLALERGDRVEARISARFMQGDYVWTWQTTALRNDDIIESMQQSTFYRTSLSPDTLKVYKPDHVPSPGEAMEVDRFILSSVDGKVSIEQICRQLSDSFPQRFETWRGAKDTVTELLLRYGDGDAMK